VPASGENREWICLFTINFGVIYRAGVGGVKSRFKDRITWNVADAGDPEILKALGTQDIVAANNFLCHMDPPMAEICLRNIARLVRPEGYLFVCGVDGPGTIEVWSR
jgi:chemotaxis methyl-accepting protein methylase